ncbi:MAG: hypothetical protein WCB26_17260 [Pseudolabrys sp.]
MSACDKTAVLFMGEGDYLWMILDVLIGLAGDLASLDMRQLDALRI